MTRTTTPVAWLVGIGALGSSTAAVVWDEAVRPEVWVGLAAPLVSAVLSWILMVKAAAGGPERLTALMLKAMAAKMVMFGLYVAAVFLVWDFRPVPFVASFTGFFIVFHAMEALFLKRLLLWNEPAA